MKNRIIYIYDALCGWCYGFSPVMKKVFEKYKDELDFDVLSGGMMMGDRVGAIDEVAPYIKTAYKQVENVTGIKFGENYINNVLLPGTAILNSEMPGIAMTVFKQFQAENAVLFAHDLQKAIYFDGIDLNEADNYIPLIEKYNINSKIFLAVMKSEESKDRTFDEFQFVGEMGISGFPTVLFAKGSEGYVLTRGYQSFDKLDAGIRQLLENQPVT
jgi:putative protein-disulfide isomerase